MKKQFPFQLLTAAILAVLTLPNLIQDGMFMDGLLYACVAKNLADGIGSFWFPHFSETMHAVFDQQPPLGFGIQAVFFKLLGSSIYVERFYSFLTLCLGAWLISNLWKDLFKDQQEIKNNSWLPVLCWIIIPVCFWSYSNNMLECTMVLFDLLAITFILKFFEKKYIPYLILAGACTFLASLTKGFQGLFPLAAIFFYWLSYRNISFLNMLRYSLLVFAIPAATYLLLFQNDSAGESLTAYLHNRVQNSISSISTVENRFYLTGRLVQELLVPIGLAVLLVALLFRKKIPIEKEKNIRHVLFFLLIGVSASFPLMVTLEQRGFYLVTSFPFFAIAIATLASPYVAGATMKLDPGKNKFKIFSVLSSLALAGAIIFSLLQAGKIKRDKETLHDVYLVGEKLSKGALLGSNITTWQNYSLQTYLMRHYLVSLSSDIPKNSDYIILDASDSLPPHVKAEKVNIPTIQYHLYKIAK